MPPNKTNTRILLLLILCQIPLALAQGQAKEDYTVLVIQSMTNPAYTESVVGVKEVLQKSPSSSRLLEYSLEGVGKNLSKILSQVDLPEVDLVLTIGTLATQLAMKDITSIPIVFAMVLDPAISGLTGKNITGASMNIPLRYQFQKIRQILPDINTIGTFYFPPETGQVIEEAIPAARSIGLTLNAYMIKYPHIFPNKVKVALQEVDAIWMVADSFICTIPNIQHLILKTLENKVPLIGLSQNYVKAGAFMALAIDYRDIGRQAGEICLKIIKGIKPADIPITFARKTQLVINRETADSIGVNIPPGLLEEIRFIR